jgi:hypothetical protein
LSDDAPIKKRSPWVYVGLGCLAFVLLGVGAVVALGAWGVHAASSWAKEMSDPKVRTQKALKVLGAASLPDGYYAQAAMSVGPLMEMAVLTDRAPGPKGPVQGYDQHMFTFLRVTQTPQDREKLRDFMDGKRDDMGMRNGYNVTTQEVIRRGAIDVTGFTLHYVAQRGEFQQAPSSPKRVGIQSVMVLDCPKDDGRARVGFWLGPDPDPSKPAKSLDLSGTNADEDVLKAFMGHFQPCDAP